MDSLPLAKQARTKSARPASGITRSRQRTWYNHPMRLTLKVFCLSLLAVALLAGSATSLAHQSTSVGKGTKRCVPEPGADCRGVVERWTVEYHGDLRKAKFTGAVLHGADFRGADLRGADFRGAKLRHADLRGANLRGARFDPVKRTGKNTKLGTACLIGAYNCDSADLSSANLQNANLGWGNFVSANLSNANLGGANVGNANWTSANLTGANLSGVWVNNVILNYANLTGANLTWADLTNSDMYYANLTNANLTNATLTNMSLSFATGCSTVTPSGFLNVIAWACAN